MLETFYASGLFIPNTCILPLYSAAKFNGMIADSGEGVIQWVPVFDGFSIKHAVRSLNLRGRDLTEYMEKYLEEIGQEFKISVKNSK